MRVYIDLEQTAIQFVYSLYLLNSIYIAYSSTNSYEFESHLSRVQFHASSDLKIFSHIVL